MNTKKSFSSILKFLILRGCKGKKTLHFKKFGFSNITRLKILHGEKISHAETRLEYFKFICRDFWIFDFKGKIAKFLKIWIFKHNSALNYSTVKKFHMKELDMNTHTHTHTHTQKKLHLAILEFFNLTGKID